MPSPRHRTGWIARRRRDRGFVLVLVLWFVMLLFVIAVSLSYQMRIGMRTADYGRKRLKATALARAGIAKAVADLKNDRLMAAADPLFNNDTVADVWADPDDKTDVALGAGTYTVRVIDENSKFDINTINPGNRLALTYLLEKVCDKDEEESRELTDAFLDYIDPDDAPIANAEMTETEYYTRWALTRYRKTIDPAYGFKAKNESLISVEELLEIPGFTWEMLFGDPVQTPQDPIVRADWKERSTALVDYLTAGTGGRINVNTAKLPVLEAMLTAAMGDAAGDVGALADQIDDLRKKSLTLSKSGGRGIMNPAEIQQAGINEAVLTALNTMFQLGQSSQFFTIVSRGSVNGVQDTERLRCFVLLQRYPLNPDIRDGRGLRDIRGFGLLKSQENFKIDPEVRVDRISEM